MGLGFHILIRRVFPDAYVICYIYSVCIVNEKFSYYGLDMWMLVTLLIENFS